MNAESDEMTCRELVDVITDYLEGALPEADRARVEQHLGECPYCVSYLDQMRATIVTLGELREESLPAPVRDDLMAAFRDWKRSA